MNLGEQLKKAREDAGYNLKKISELTKIQVKYLERLENGQYDKLPAPVYTQGFLKKCAQVLNLPAEDILAQYQKEKKMASGADNSKKEGEIKSLPSLSFPRFIITPRTIRWILLVAALFLIVGYLLYQLNYLIAPPSFFLDYPFEDIVTNSSSLEIFGRADSSARLTVNDQDIYIDKDGRFRQEINLSPGLNTLKIEAVNRFGKKSEITRQIIVK